MKDQAEKLREIINHLKAQQTKPEDMGYRTNKVITVTSGKGGVGKTNISVNLSIDLVKKGYRVLILDADLGLSNIELLFGITPKYTLLDLINKDMNILDIVNTGPMGIKFISGGSGIEQLVNMEDKELETMIKKISQLDKIADIILVDTGAGISKNVTNFIIAADEVILVTTPEPTSVTDAYTLLKTIVHKEGKKDIKLLVNRVESEREALATINKICFATETFLQMQLKSLGYVSYDENVIKSVKQQEPFILNYPKTIASRQIKQIAGKLMDKETKDTKETPGIKIFFRKLIGSNSV